MILYYILLLGTPRRLIFVSSHEKFFSIFGVPKSGFFVKQQPKRRIKAGKNTPHKYYATWNTHINSRFVAAAFGGVF
jgi:hypothetical protein